MMQPDMFIEKGTRRVRALRRRATGICIAAMLIACFWFGGAAGRVGWLVLGRFMPIRAGHLIVTGTVSRAPGSRPDMGLTLALDSSRLKAAIAAEMPCFRLIPPGFIRSGTAVCGRLDIGGRTTSSKAYHLPVMLAVDDTIRVPRLVCRWPADEFNRFLVEQVFPDGLRRRKKWALGHYELVYELAFKTFRIISEPIPPGLPVDKREFSFEATGRVRMWIEENLVTLRKTADVDRLAGRIIFKPVRDGSAAGFDYEATIDTLEADFNDMPPWAESKPERSLREALEHSLNKEKNKRRVRNVSLPSWTPLDLMIDFEIAGHQPDDLSAPP